MNTSGLLKLKAILADRGRDAAVLLAVIGLVAVASAGTLYVDRPTESVAETRHSQTVESTVQTSVVVTGDSDLWERGTRLEDQPVYLRSAASNLTLTAETSFREPTSGEVRQRLVVVHRAKTDGETLWKSERELASDTSSVTDSAELATTVNVSEIAQRRSEIKQEVSGVASVSTHLRLLVTYRTDRYAGELNATAPFQVSQKTFAIEGDLGATQSHDTVVQVDRPRPSASPEAFGVGLFGLVALFGSAVVGAFAVYGPDSRSVERDLHRARYAEWISGGTLPAEPADQRIRMESLVDLIDVGIDSNKRVVHDVERGLYGVIDGRVFYCYPDDSVRVDTEPDDTEPAPSALATARRRVATALADWAERTRRVVRSLYARSKRAAANGRTMGKRIAQVDRTAAARRIAETRRVAEAKRIVSGLPDRLRRAAGSDDRNEDALAPIDHGEKRRDDSDERRDDSEDRWEF